MQLANFAATELSRELPLLHSCAACRTPCSVPSRGPPGSSRPRDALLGRCLPVPRRWDAKTLMTIALWVGVAPYAVYKGSIGEFNHVDRAYNRSERAMLGNTK